MEVRERERLTDTSIGYASLALFGASIVVLIWFLLAGLDPSEERVDAIGRALGAPGGRGDARATFNTLLILAWGFGHSFMASPGVRDRIRRLLRPHLERAVYSLTSSVTLILLCLLYRPIAHPVYALEGGAALLTRLLFYAAWALFIYCWAHLDLLEITGLRPIQRHLDDVPGPAQPFRPGGPFLWVRHPVELSFLLAFWAAPRMTVGHLLFAALMTLYTFIDVDLEDRRMLRLQGAEYADYMQRVPQILPLPR